MDYLNWPENTLEEDEYDRLWESEEVQTLLSKRQELEIALEREKGRLIWEYLAEKSDEFPPFLNNQRME